MGAGFSREYDVDPSQGGAFGLDTVQAAFPSFVSTGFNYAVIEDITNNLSVYKLPALP